MLNIRRWIVNHLASPMTFQICNNFIILFRGTIVVFSVQRNYYINWIRIHVRNSVFGIPRNRDIRHVANAHEDRNYNFHWRREFYYLDYCSILIDNVLTLQHSTGTVKFEIEYESQFGLHSNLLEFYSVFILRLKISRKIAIWVSIWLMSNFSCWFQEREERESR